MVPPHRQLTTVIGHPQMGTTKITRQRWCRCQGRVLLLQPLLWTTSQATMSGTLRGGPRGTSCHRRCRQRLQLRSTRRGGIREDQGRENAIGAETSGTVVVTASTDSAEYWKEVTFVASKTRFIGCATEWKSLSLALSSNNVYGSPILWCNLGEGPQDMRNSRDKLSVFPF